MSRDENTAKKIVTLQPTDGKFDFNDAPPFALAYLNTYYNQPPTADENAVSLFLTEQFRRKAPRGKFLEVGCGPTVHHIFPFAPHVDEIHMADYLQENLDQVKLWRDAAPGAHDWRPYVGMTLGHEGGDRSSRAVEERQAEARKKLTKLLHCDLKAEIPKEHRGQYDCVGCFYCAEEVGISLQEWQQVLRRVGDYLKPGGTLYMAALGGMDTYQVRDRTGTLVEYPCANVTEAGILEALPRAGFRRDTMVVKSSDIEVPDCGVTGTISVAAVKS